MIVAHTTAKRVPRVSNWCTMAVNKRQVTEAVNYLISSPSYSKLINEITSVIERWDTHPMAYGGELTMLNSLIDIGLANRDAFERLLQMVEDKRKLEPQTKRMDYQRQLMRDRRARVAKALELHELSHGQLEADARRDYTKGLVWRWREARDEFIQSKGKIKWAQRNAAATEFWEIVDRQLDINLRAARTKR